MRSTVLLSSGDGGAASIQRFGEESEVSDERGKLKHPNGDPSERGKLKHPDSGPDFEAHQLKPTTGDRGKLKHPNGDPSERAKLKHPNSEPDFEAHILYKD